MRERETLNAVPAVRLVHHDGRTRRAPEFTQAEKRKIFAEMVIAELEGGLLRYSRRRSLLRFAEDMGIPAFDANLLIAQAQHRNRQIAPAEFDATLDFPTAVHPETWSASYKLLFALITAAIINLLVIGWMMH